MPCSINILMTLQTEILSAVTSDFLKQMIIFKSFNSVLSITFSGVVRVSGINLGSSFLVSELCFVTIH